MTTRLPSRFVGLSGRLARVLGRIARPDFFDPLPNAMDWEKRLKLVLERDRQPERTRYANANVSAVKAAISGIGPDDPAGQPTPSGMGARMVVNISAAHIPAFCRASANHEPKPYKNAYDLGRYSVGDPPPDLAKSLRELVDDALPLPAATRHDVYFGAMELNGAGVSFYGDICLVLKEVPDQTVLLDRNSYDLVRSPFRDIIEHPCDSSKWTARRARMAEHMSGTWGPSRALIAAIKVLENLGSRARRFTTGQISAALLDDEDYIEILRLGSFGTQDLAEARLGAADAAREASIDDRRRAGIIPPLEALLWRDRRQVAERELRACGVSVRVVTTMGRVRG